MIPTIQYTYEGTLVPLAFAAVITGLLVLATVASHLIIRALHKRKPTTGGREPRNDTLTYIIGSVAFMFGFIGLMLSMVMSEEDRRDGEAAQTGAWLEEHYGFTLSDHDLRYMTASRGDEGNPFFAVEYEGESISVHLERAPGGSRDDALYVLTQQNTLPVPTKGR